MGSIGQALSNKHPNATANPLTDPSAMTAAPGPSKQDTSVIGKLMQAAASTKAKAPASTKVPAGGGGNVQQSKDLSAAPAQSQTGYMTLLGGTR